MRRWTDLRGIRFVCALSLTIPAATANAAGVPGANWSAAESPAELGWSSERLEQAREFAGTLDTAAVMIVEDGIVVDAWGPTALPLRCHSVRKSLLSALYGPQVESGRIDLDRTLEQLGINDNEPSLTDAERRACIRDILCARSGVYHPALYETAAMAAARPERGVHAPDTFWYYNNWDFNAAGSIFENLTGRSIFEEFEDRIAGTLELEDFRRDRHTQYVTGDDSVHPAYPFELSTRDLARVGLLFLRGGNWGGELVIPEAWVRESTTSYSDTGGSGGYGYMWWVAVDGVHFPGVTLPHGSYSARGHRGQFLVVIPAWDLVVCHRVNTFQRDTAVSKSEFGALLALILAARPDGASAESAAVTVEDVATSTDPEFDLIIRNGEVIDGTGRERFRADVAVRDGVIAKVGPLTDATGRLVIDARGKLVAPGFIDLHSHAEEGLISDDPARRSAPNLITQGITTVVVNQDGGGPLDLEQQRRLMRERGTGLNVVQVLGHGTIRRAVMGDDHQRPASPEEIERMRQHLDAALAGGAWGMSAGLEYVPGRWSTMREMESLSQTVAEWDGVTIVHERSSGSRPMWFLPSRDSASQPSMLDNLEELILVAESTGVRTVATHIKARGVDFWGSSARMNELIRAARADGLEFYADQYAYNTSGSDGRIVLIPSWAGHRDEAADDGETDYSSLLESVLADDARAADLREDVEYEITRRGGADNILILEHPKDEVVGKSLAEFAAAREIDPVEAAIELQLKGDATRRGGARLRAFSMSEADVEAFARTAWTATSSDAGIALPEDGPVHPRFYGAFPRKIRHYAIDRGLMSVEEAVRVSTSLPAGILKLDGRGVLQEGAGADIVVFDPEHIRDTADAFHPHRYAEGIDYVLVNGKLAVERGRWLGSLEGDVLVRAQSAVQATDVAPTLRETIKRGQRLAELGRLDEALELFSNVIASAPDASVGYRLRAETAMKNLILADFRTVVSDWTEVIRIDGPDPGDLCKRGVAYYHAGDVVRAEQDFDAALDLEPEYHDALNNLGVLAFDRGEAQDALSYFSRAIESHAEYADAYAHRGHIHYTEGRLEEALADQDKAIQFAPRASFQVYVDRGDTHAAREDWNAAIRDYDSAIQLDYYGAGLVGVFGKRGEAYRVTGEVERSAVDFSRDREFRARP